MSCAKGSNQDRKLVGACYAIILLLPKKIFIEEPGAKIQSDSIMQDDPMFATNYKKSQNLKVWYQLGRVGPRLQISHICTLIFGLFFTNLP